MSSLRETVIENKKIKHPFDYVTLNKEEVTWTCNVGH